MTDLDILCPPTATINIAGQIIEIKPLSIKAAISLGRVLGQLRTEVLSASKENPQNFLPKLLELAGTNKAREIIDILTNYALNGIKNLEDKVTLYEISNLAKVAAEVNNFPSILLNFQVALKGTNK